MGLDFDLIIFCYFFSISLFVYWFDFVTGGPLSLFPDSKQILSFIPSYFAKRRLKKAGIYDELKKQYDKEILLTDDKEIKRDTKVSFNNDIIRVGSKYFIHEKFMFCPICLQFWISFIIGIILIFHISFFTLVFYYLINHFILRKLIL